MSLDLESSVKPVKIYSSSYNSFDQSKESPIILIHGMFSSHRTWNQIKSKLGDRTKRCVIFYDLRNHGKSEHSDENILEMENDVEDLKNLMEQNNISKAILIAHSLGARIAMTFALKYESMVEKLIVEDMSIKYNDSAIKSYQNLASVLQQMNKIFKTFPPSFSEEEAQKRITKFVSDSIPELSTGSSKSKFHVYAPLHKDFKSNKIVWDINLNLFEEMKKRSIIYEIDLENNPVYNGDTLFITGDHSEFPLDKEMIPKYFPKSQFKNFENGFHAFHQEDPEQFLNIVIDFIKNSKL